MVWKPESLDVDLRPHVEAMIFPWFDLPQQKMEITFPVKPFMLATEVVNINGSSMPAVRGGDTNCSSSSFEALQVARTEALKLSEADPQYDKAVAALLTAEAADDPSGSNPTRWKRKTVPDVDFARRVIVDTLCADHRSKRAQKTRVQRSEPPPRVAQRGCHSSEIAKRKTVPNVAFARRMVVDVLSAECRRKREEKTGVERLQVPPRAVQRVAGSNHSSAKSAKRKTVPNMVLARQMIVGALSEERRSKRVQSTI